MVARMFRCKGEGQIAPPDAECVAVLKDHKFFRCPVCGRICAVKADDRKFRPHQRKALKMSRFYKD